VTGFVARPGVYEMDEATYHGDPVPGGSLSCSNAKLILPPGSPARFRAAQSEPRAPSRVLDFGTAAHREVLGTGWPLAVWAGEDWTLKAAQDFRKAARAAGQVAILAREQQQIKTMAAAIEAHPSARLLLGAEEVMNEQSLFWFDDEFGIWRRARLDAVRLRGRVLIVDYKTAASADPVEFAKAAARYKYHWQDPWYREAVARTLGDAEAGFLFVAQEKDPPYCVGIYELDDEAVALGEAKIAAACTVYARCRAAGDWPGPQPSGDVVTRISLPRWARYE
jgi:hypothetical protein